jgi:hypothetical protein
MDDCQKTDFNSVGNIGASVTKSSLELPAGASAASLDDGRSVIFGK